MNMMQFTGSHDRLFVNTRQRRTPRVYARPAATASVDQGVTPLDIAAGIVAVAATIGFAAVCFAIA